MYYAAQLLVIDCSFNSFIILHTVLCKSIARELCEFRKNYNTERNANLRVTYIYSLGVQLS